MAAGSGSRRGFVIIALALMLIPGVIDTTQAAEWTSLEGMFLVAAPGMPDPRFRNSVLLITEHTEQGARAIMINHPTTTALGDALPEIDALAGRSDLFLYIGGPVAIGSVSLLVQTDEAAEGIGLERVFANLYLSKDHRPITELLDRPRTRFRAYAGYAGWFPGQLEAELGSGGWHLRRGQIAFIFDRPAGEIWSDLLNLGRSLLQARLDAAGTSGWRPQ